MHIPLAELLEMDGSTTLVRQWVTAMRAGWAAHRAAASEGGGDIGAWLDGDAARAVACDAAIAPVVTGEVNPAALEDLVRLCVQLDKLRRHGTPEGDGTDDAADAGAPADTSRAWEAIEQAILGKTMDFLLHYIDACDLRLHPRTSSRQMSVALEGSDPCHTPGSPQPHPRPRAAQRFGLGTSRG